MDNDDKKDNEEQDGEQGKNTEEERPPRLSRAERAAALRALAANRTRNNQSTNEVVEADAKKKSDGEETAKPPATTTQTVSNEAAHSPAVVPPCKETAPQGSTSDHAVDVFDVTTSNTARAPSFPAAQAKKDKQRTTPAAADLTKLLESSQVALVNENQASKQVRTAVPAVCHTHNEHSHMTCIYTQRTHTGEPFLVDL